MVTIQGKLIFNDGCYIGPYAPCNKPISNVSIILQNQSTKDGIVVLTNNNGEFSFINVPENQIYQLVESYGFPATKIGSADFSNATNLGAVTSMDPPISYISDPPASATKVNSISPNTIILDIKT